MGIGDKQEQIWNIVAAILHLGNIEFIPNKDGSAIKNANELQVISCVLFSIRH
jgi:myosin heavy subunit